MDDFWTIKAGGLTQSADAWGIDGMVISGRINEVGTVKFKLSGADVDGAQPFAYKEELTIYRNGVPCFVGIVTDIPRKADENDEAIYYVVSDPWWWAEQTIFQQQWVTGNAITGAAQITQTTTQSDVLLGQSLDLVKMDSGQVMLEALYYLLYACQGLDFPATVDVNHLPPAPSMTAGPFQIGRLTPDITVPYIPCRDQSCAEMINILLKFTPDAVRWFDYSTTPPTLNIDRRGNLPVKAIAFGQIASKFNPRPRNDLVLPAVIVKFQQHLNLDGTDLLVQTVQSYPPGAKDNAPGTWVQTIDLVGASVTYVKQTVSVTSRPTAQSTQEQALQWLLNHNSTLADLYDFSLATLDANLLNLDKLETVIDPNDPVLKSPYDFPADGTGLNSELIAGAVTPWMWDLDNLVAAEATIKFTFSYSGSDDATAKYFAGQPTSGSLVIPVRCKITNAGGIVGFNPGLTTLEYSTTASAQTGEPVPAGYAEYLYKAMEQLHWDGDLTMIEDECSDMLPIGCTFNVTDGLEDWQAMNALVLSVTQDIDNGTTTVVFGPPVKMGLDTMEELFRANLGVLPSFKLGQRNTGLSEDGGNVVQGHTHSSASSSHLPPGGGAPNTPFKILQRTNPADPSGNTFQYKIWVNSAMYDSLNQSDTVPVDKLDVWRNLDADDTIWIVSAVANPLAIGSPGPTVKSYGNGDTDYVKNAPTFGAGNETEFNTATPPVQTWFRIVLGTSIADAKGKPNIVQSVLTNLKLAQGSVNGRTVLYPIPK